MLVQVDEAELPERRPIEYCGCWKPWFLQAGCPDRANSKGAVWRGVAIGW